jgi:hypothetical protein
MNKANNQSGKEQAWGCEAILMDKLRKKVKNSLLEFFTENELLFEGNPDGRVSGFIVSKKICRYGRTRPSTQNWGIAAKESHSVRAFKDYRLHYVHAERT